MNKVVGVILHEFAHIMAFISFQDMQKDYVTFSKKLNTFVWTGPNVLREARIYFGCPSLASVPLQTKNGRAGGHWNEAFLANEIMTPITGDDADRFSRMSMALLEDTNWYKANYDFAENYTYAKRQGCDTFKSKCQSPAPCIMNGKDQMGPQFSTLGHCQQDKNGCPTYKPYSNQKCEVDSNPGPEDVLKKMGAVYGGNCTFANGKFALFKGSQYSYSSMSTGMLSLQTECNTDMTSYTLQLKGYANFDMNSYTYSGDKIIKCTRKGEKKVIHKINGVESFVTCEDPKILCEARFGGNGEGKNSCDKSCVKYGRCQPGNANTTRRLS